MVNCDNSKFVNLEAYVVLSRTTKKTFLAICGFESQHYRRIEFGIQRPSVRETIFNKYWIRNKRRISKQENENGNLPNCQFNNFIVVIIHHQHQQQDQV